MWIDPLTAIWLVTLPVFMAVVGVIAAVLHVAVRAVRRRGRGASQPQVARSSGLVVVVAGGLAAVLGYGWMLTFFLTEGRLLAPVGAWNVLIGGLLLAAGLLALLVGAILTAPPTASAKIQP